MTQTKQQPDSSASRTIRPLDFESILEDLDTCELTPVQFRVYCHLLRAIDESGKVSRSSESIAKVCKLTRITVLRVLVQLERMGMVLCDRTIGKKTVYKLQPPSFWRSTQPVENEAIALSSKVVPFPVSTTCKPDLQVLEINTVKEEQVTPFKGVTCPPLVTSVEGVNEVNRSTIDTGVEQELTLEQKLEACRQIGCNAGQVWRDGQLEILVNGLFMSVESFMERKLSSFKEILQPCETGLNLCREAIAQIKQKIAIARCNKLEISLSKNHLEQGYCNG